MENNNKRKKSTSLLLSILGVLSLVLITAGVTYAFFSYAKEGQTVNTIRTGTIEFAYNETDGMGQGINITNAMPTDDNTGSNLTQGANEYGNLFRFTITSKTPSTAKIPYYITLRKTGGLLGNAQVKAYLEATPAGTEEGAANYTFTGTKGGNDFAVSTFAALLQAHPASGITMIGSNAQGDEAVMYKGTIPANQGDTYTNSFVLRMWLTGGANAGNDIADYSPYEFMLKTVANASDAPITTTTYVCIKAGEEIAAVDSNACTTAEGTWTAKTITLPKATNTTAIDAEARIQDGSFITSTAYYALPETASCNDSTIQTEGACTGNYNVSTPRVWDGTACNDPEIDNEGECTGNYDVATPRRWTKARGEYERIGYVNTTAKTVYTLSQTLAGDPAMATVDEFGNYTFSNVDNFTATEQYYRLNGATFTAIVNVYADATVVTNP